MFGWLRRVHQVYVLDVRARVDAQAGPSPEADRQMVVVVGTVLASLIFMTFYGSAVRLGNWTDLLGSLGLDAWGDALRDALTGGEDARLARKVFWAGTRVVGYVLLPMAVAVVAFRGRHRVDLRELFGLELRGFFVHVRAYLFMLLVIMPFVVGASFAPSFQRKYPFYRLQEGESLWPSFVMWELLYAAQFLALEIFYRGFMVHGLKPRLGWASIFVMMIPYMMIHFGKPLPECVGSIVAGFVLGTMSLKSGAIWWGAILHIVVAWTMDGLSLWHQGRLFAGSG